MNELPVIGVVRLCIAILISLIACGCAAAPPVPRFSSSSPSPSPSAVSIAISPTAATVSVDNTQQFAATISNTANTAVSWTVNGVPGGAAATGTIASSGLYTAPAIVPADAVVQISAIAQANPSKSAAASVTIAHLPIGHVFLLTEENHGYSSVIGSSSMPYLNSLAARYGLATNYYANAHPSIGNYFMLTTGELVTTDDTFTGTVNRDNLVRELIAAGKVDGTQLRS